MGLLRKKTPTPEPATLPASAVYTNPTPEDVAPWEALVQTQRATRSRVTRIDGVTVTYERIGEGT